MVGLFLFLGGFLIEFHYNTYPNFIKGHQDEAICYGFISRIIN